MELKKTIASIEKKIKTEKDVELEKILEELKKVDENLKEEEARNQAVEEIKRKNDHIEWVNIKDV
ncbi:hypothetical protein H5J22_01920 [Cetobacterium sp. 8H]|uniref:hypothetical protein n=1 Tax=Cetobacterium sp. 8H TaxID=2759681 RepID=UPI00163C8FFC|nr:hypothetical protein [Cetobacterium sp. 8H]MBC2850210.1 hypothetical protein [Cetobacterium sp. 8H]